MTKNNDLHQCEDLKILVKEIYILDINIKKIYNDIKFKYKDINIVIVNPNIVFGLEHILSIIKIISGKIKRNKKREIKNLDIEFLLRICYTDQIANAFQKLNDAKDKNNKDSEFICILFSKNPSDIENALKDLKKYDLQENALKEKKPEDEVNNRTIKTDSLIEISNRKKQYILKNLFKKELEDVNELFFIKDNFKFQKFLIERAAIALK
jgi:tRNA threonylcarbamoyladenosine modification (KEOPS) complex Cgi121 subunit